MKRLFIVLLCFILIALFIFGLLFYPFFKAADTDPSAEDGIYLYTKLGCPYCYMAEEYIAKNHPNLKIEVKVIQTTKDVQLMMACAERFGLNKLRLGTPLICMPNHYIMGWSKDTGKLFDEYVAQYLQNKQK